MRLRPISFALALSLGVTAAAGLTACGKKTNPYEPDDAGEYLEAPPAQATGAGRAPVTATTGDPLQGH